MAVLRVTGLASGMDIDEIVGKLMTAARVPVDRLKQDRQLWEWRKADYLSVNRLLKDLRDATVEMRLESTYLAKVADSSETDIVTATPATDAALQTHTVEVTRLASGVNLASTSAITLPGGDRSSLSSQVGLDAEATFTIRLLDPSDGSSIRAASFTVKPTGTIYEVVNAINNARLEIRASYDAAHDRFFLTSEKTGRPAYFQFEDPDSFLRDKLKLPLASELEVLQGTTASVNVDGATGLLSDTNEVTVNNVTYHLHRASPGTEVAVTVRSDVDTVVSKIKSYVEKYNEVIAGIHAKLDEERFYEYPPLTDAQKEEMTEEEVSKWEEKAKSGLIRHDWLVTSQLSALRQRVSMPVNDTGSSYSSLAAIGITTGSYQEKGKLYIDEAQLRRAVAADPEGVAKLFTQEGASEGRLGIAKRIDDQLSGAISAITTRAGVTEGIDSSLVGRILNDLDRRIDDAEERLKKKEEEYYRRFALMEQVISQLNVQSAWLMQFVQGSGTSS